MKEKDKSNYNRAVKYTGLFGGVQVITLLASILRNKLVAVILGPAGLGIISIYNSVTKLLNDSTNLGISFSAVRNIAEISALDDQKKLEDYINVVRSWSIMTALFGIFMCMSLSSLLSYWTFGNYEYTGNFIALSPIVGCMALSGGELAILKATRQLRQVSLSSVLGAISTLFISVPIYYTFGLKGIIPSLILSVGAVTGIILYYSLRFQPFKLSGNFKGDLIAGSSMIKLGVPFILAGILGSGAEYIIRSFLLRSSSEEMVGFYNAGFVITVTYAGMIFAAMETDYFPRLSAVNNHRKKMSQLVNQQIEIAVLLITPLLIGFLLFIPIILQILYSSEFLPVIRMAECATLGMFFKAVTLPIAYIPLAKGKSVAYFILELLYDVCIVILVIAGFNKYGLAGTGIAITIAGLFNFLIVYPWTRFNYKFRLSKDMICTALAQTPWIVITFILTFPERSRFFWIFGIACLFISTTISFYLLHKKTTIINLIISRFKR